MAHIQQHELDVAETTNHDGHRQILDWSGPDDPENPYNWPKSKKTVVTAVALFATFTTMLNGTIMTVAHDAINHRFGVSDAAFPHSYWPVTSWAVGGALCSFAVLPLMEDFGLRRVFLATYAALIASLIPQALAPTFATLVATRFLSGGAVAVLANSTSSVIGNVWDGDAARSVPMSLWITFYLAGSSAGPVVGAAILARLPSWRWLFWCQLVWFAVSFPLYLLFLPESRGAVLLARRRARELRREGGSTVYTRPELEQKNDNTPLAELVAVSLKRPLHMLFTEPVVMVVAAAAALIIGNTYLFTQSVEQVFAGLYGWGPVRAGYVQAAVVAGELLVGWPLTLVSARLYLASAARNAEVRGVPIPEARLYVSVPAGFVLMAGGMFVYGWTAYAALPWVAPAVGLAMIGAGNNVVITAFADYAVDAYARFAGSAMAAVALGENLCAGFLPLAAQSLYTRLGFHWASTLLGCLSLVLSCAPVVLIVWGREVRSRSPFMKEATLEKKLEVQVDGTP
ncbi:mfs multidrug transporter [Diplodia corticola]|uniref:Mfs multidrug transporter n=1 Tax=Diplodia corticola TaxID=236234 RepID=A0A1J9RSC0_9PEZI|nr:mfs multidrug transporter [Diplodia corticola]OJD30421.1 mfs multidrug transporter [Diplodia corticola]